MLVSFISPFFMMTYNNLIINPLSIGSPSLSQPPEHRQQITSKGLGNNYVVSETKWLIVL
jgi:hypothetical protein